MKSVLVRNGKHQRPMLAVLNRANIGNPDAYNRGRWISEKDLPAILNAIRNHPTAQQASSKSWDWLCHGTNIHNDARFSSFLELFNMNDYTEV